MRLDVAAIVCEYDCKETENNVCQHYFPNAAAKIDYFQNTVAKLEKHANNDV